MSLTPEEMKMVGGSDVAAIAGVSPYGSAYAVWERIVHGSAREDTPALSRGRRLEPVVLDWYAEQTGRDLVRNVRWQTGDPRLRASLDATSCEGGREWDRVVDAKTAGANESSRWGEEGTDSIPGEYIVQFTWYMGLTRRERTDVPALIAGDFRLYVVGFDAEVYGELRERVDRFWVDHILTGKPPDVTALPNDVEALKRRFPRHETSEHLDFSTMPPEQQTVLEEYIRSYAEQDAATQRLAVWEARAKLLVGTAPGVKNLPEELGFHRLDWKQQKGGARTDWEAVARVLAARAFLPTEMDECFKPLIQQHTTATEGKRPFTPRALTKRGVR